MLGPLISFGMLFVRRKTAPFAWGAVLVVALAAYGAWSWFTIHDLSRDNKELVKDNKGLTAANTKLVKDQKDILDRVEMVADAVVDLNGKFNKAIVRRGQTVDSMTTPPPKPGERPDTAAMEDRANTGMNAVFNDLNALSRENLK